MQKSKTEKTSTNLNLVHNTKPIYELTSLYKSVKYVNLLRSVPIDKPNTIEHKLKKHNRNLSIFTEYRVPNTKFRKIRNAL